jgi:hypothetical protein
MIAALAGGFVRIGTPARVAIVKTSCPGMLALNMLDFMTLCLVIGYNNIGQTC